MSADLAHWLLQHRPILMSRWSAALAEPSERNGAVDGTLSAVAEVVVSSLEPLFDGLVRLAHGSPNELRTVLRDASRASSELGLSDLLNVSFQFRHISRDVLMQQNESSAITLNLLSHLDDLVDTTLDAMARAWTEHTHELIREREFIAESLDAASAAADQRALQLKALNDISQRLSALLEEGQILELVASSLARLTEVAHIAVWVSEILADGPILKVVLTHGDEISPLMGTVLPIEQSDDLVVRSYITRQLQFEPNPDAVSQMWHQPECGVLSLPMVISETAIGVILLQDPNPVEQLRFQQDLAQGVINQAAIALQNARLYAEVRELNIDLERRVQERTRQLQEEKERLATVHDIAAEVSSVLDLDVLLNTSLQLLVNITQSEHASIMLVEEGSNLLVTRAVLGHNSSNSFTRFPFGAGIAGWVAQNKRSALVPDVGDDLRWIEVPGGSERKRDGSMIAVPLISQGNVTGVLTVSHREAGFFHEDHLRLLNACAGSIATGINNAKLYTLINDEVMRRTELLEHQQKEASQISAILESLADGVVVCGVNGSVLMANPAATRIFQRSIEELLVWNLHDLLRRYLGNRAAELPLDELLARPQTPQGASRFFTTTIKIGMRVLSVTLGPVFKEGREDELIGALMVARDITREVEADRLKVEFIGTMSHELRTPMTAIKGFTQLLAMGGLGPLNDTQREFVNTIYQNTERMIALINDVLDITKIESGSVDLEMRSLHLAEALSGVMAELQTLINDRKHELSITIPPGLPLVRSDAHRLHQILYNVLSNAVKYTPRNGKITVAARETALTDLPNEVRDNLSPERRYVRIDVRDTGVGIDPVDLPRVFDRFYRTENPLKIEAGGTGLGLSLAKPLVELMGGRIWAESVLNDGSTFSFVLPVGERI